MDKSKVFRPLLSLAGKEGLTFDEDIPLSYIARKCLEQGACLLRGFVRSGGFADRSGPCLIGSRVVFRRKSLVHMGSKVRLSDGVFIDALSKEGVALGDGVLLGRNCRIECTGSLEHVGKGVRIGSGSTFGSDCYFGAAGGIVIGEDVMAGQYVRFHAENHVSVDPDVPIRSQGVTHEGIKIGDGVWIGAGAVFLDGADVGRGCVVAANAVVTGKSWPPYSVIGGVPAKVLKSRLK